MPPTTQTETTQTQTPAEETPTTQTPEQGAGAAPAPTEETGAEESGEADASGQSYEDVFEGGGDDLDLDENDLSQGEEGKQPPTPDPKEGQPQGQEATPPAKPADGKEEATGPEAKTGEDGKPAADSGQQPAKPEAQQPAEQKKEGEAAKPEGEQLTPEKVQERYQEWRAQTEDVLAKGHYNLSEEQIERLESEPATEIPKLLSKVYLDAVTMAVGQVEQMLPRVIEQTTQQRTAYEKNESTFFEAWPQLKDERYLGTIQQIGLAYRNASPRASTEDFIRDVGASALVALKLPYGGEGGQQAPAPNGNGATPPAASQGFKPASASPRPAAPQPQGLDGFARVDDDLFGKEDLDLG